MPLVNKEVDLDNKSGRIEPGGKDKEKEGRIRELPVGTGEARYEVTCLISW